jgi:exopolyphosphatase/guanosine-5'-triphosphate,3'-diphosphate pyrophosphatase
VKLLAILKVANAMDRSHKQRLKRVKMSVRNDQLFISIEADDSISLEKGLFREKADFFQRVFAIRPVIKEKRM